MYAIRRFSVNLFARSQESFPSALIVENNKRLEMATFHADFASKANPLLSYESTMQETRFLRICKNIQGYPLDAWTAKGIVTEF